MFETHLPATVWSTDIHIYLEPLSLSVEVAFGHSGMAVFHLTVARTLV